MARKTWHGQSPLLLLLLAFTFGLIVGAEWL